MKKTIMAVMISNRRAAVPSVQAVLTEYGCIVKTRLGIHDAVVDKGADCGFVILELVGTTKEQKAFEGKLKKLKGVSVKMIEISCK